MSSTSFQVVYDGPALEGSTIDVRDLAPALLAFGDAVEQANLTLNDSRAKVSLRVNASFKSGCFGIDFTVAQSLIDQMHALFASEQVTKAKDIAELLGFVWDAGGKAITAAGGVIYAVRWLRNRQITKVVLLTNGNAVIEVDEDKLEVEQRTLALLRNHKLRLALQRAIAEPLEREGFESVAITSDPAKGFTVISKAERSYFVAPPASTEKLSENEGVANLQLVSVSFKDDNKWRFYDGTNSFYATMDAPDFLRRVQSGEEAFSAGDILTVRLRRRQWLEGDVMKSEYSVEEVLGHRRGMAQIAMPLVPGRDGGSA